MMVKLKSIGGVYKDIETAKEDVDVSLFPCKIETRSCGYVMQKEERV